MAEKPFIKRLMQLAACPEAIQWARQFDTLQAAWDVCQRGDWMLWLLGRTCGEWGSPAHRRVVGLSCKVARLSKPGRKSLTILRLVEAFAAGQPISRTELKAAAESARAAAYSAQAAESAWPAAYSAEAAESAWAAAYSAQATASSAQAAASSAQAAASSARAVRLAEIADMIRDAVPLFSEKGDAK
jgi:hypothetical protein